MLINITGCQFGLLNVYYRKEIRKNGKIDRDIRRN